MPVVDPMVLKVGVALIVLVAAFFLVRRMFRRKPAGQKRTENRPATRTTQSSAKAPASAKQPGRDLPESITGRGKVKITKVDLEGRYLKGTSGQEEVFIDLSLAERSGVRNPAVGQELNVEWGKSRYKPRLDAKTVSA